MRADERREREANYFAMCLLMPEKLVRRWVREHGSGFDWGDDDSLGLLAKDFGVSMTLAAIRLSDLGFFQRSVRGHK
jgi:Zn-dependent peptidase ImmA (M78 family)